LREPLEQGSALFVRKLVILSRLWVQPRVPEALDELPDQEQAFVQPLERVGVHLRFYEPDGDLQIFATPLERFGGEVLGSSPARALFDPAIGPHPARMTVAAPEVFQRPKLKLPPSRNAHDLPGGRLSRDRIEDPGVAAGQIVFVEKPHPGPSLI